MIEACVAVGGQLADHEALHAPILAAWQRRVALGGLLALLGFLGTLDESVSLGVPWFDWYAAWSGGFLFALPCLLAAWAALRPGPVILRLPQLLALAAFFSLANGWSAHHYPDGLEHAISEWGLVLLPQTLVLTAAFTLLRRRRGWRIRLRKDEDDLDAKGVQFSLRQILVWITGAAVILALVRWISPECRIVDDWFDLVLGMAVCSVGALVLAIAFVALLPLVLGADSRRRLAVRTVVTAASSAAVLWLMCLLVGWVANQAEPLSNAVDVAVYIGWICVGSLVVDLLALIVLRLCGFRLVRTSSGPSAGMAPGDAPVARQHGAPAIQESQEVVLAQPKATVRFGWIAGLLALAFVALLGPASDVDSERSRVAEDWKREQRWAAFGAISQLSVQTNEGRVVSLEFPPDHPVSPDALEKLRQDADTLKVRSLTLSGQPIVDDGLRYLRALKDLRCLRLDRTRITDAGLAHLVGLTGLEELDLAHTKVTDEGLKVLARMPSLTTLGLDGTAISDAGLAHLEPLGRLEVIYLAQTKATQEGITAFHSARPGRQVILQGAENLIRQMQALGAAARVSPVR